MHLHFSRVLHTVLIYTRACIKNSIFRCSYQRTIGKTCSNAFQQAHMVLEGFDSVTVSEESDKLCEERYFEETIESIVVLGWHLSKYIAYSLLKACSHDKHVRKIHSLIVCSGLEKDAFLGSHLIRLFASFGCLDDANDVFHKLVKPTVHTWAAIISANAKHGKGDAALKLYSRMQHSGLTSNRYVYIAVLKACAVVSDLTRGGLIHEEIIKSGLELDIILVNTLIDMYGKCGDLEMAREIFDSLSNRDIFSWGAMIAGYCQHSEGTAALELFEEMQEEGIKPNKIVCSSALKACGIIGAIDQGRLIHEHIAKGRYESDLVVGNALIDMYAKCGMLEEAQEVFDNLQKKNLVSWNTMIVGFSQHDSGLHALGLYDKMQQESVNPDAVTFSSVLKACSSLNAIEHGRVIHGQIIECQLQNNIFVGSTLVDMYAKCGSLEEARLIFESLPEKNVVSWNAMITGYAHSGNFWLARRYLESMQSKGIRPDETTFTSILVACRNAGLVDEGRRYFKYMREIHGIVPDAHHYSCMADLLGRAGCLEEAENLLNGTNQATIVSWTSLLNSCRMHRDMEIGRRCFHEVVRLDAHCSSAYVLASNIFANASRREDVSRIIKR